MSSFPRAGRSREAVLSALTDARARDLAADGRAFAFVYDAGEPLRALAREAYAACMPVNGLDPTVYPSARTLERGVVHGCLELMRAPEGAAGTATAGGTESVMLAVKVARDWARQHRPHVARPKMLLPITAHACFHKASHYLGVEMVPVAVDPVTFRADVADARAKMSDEVVMVVGSAPSYAHGVVDPIAELAALAREHGALMHVDACVGGLVLPFLREAGRDLGRPVPAFDFTVEGVTSISMDLHKYGFAPKGVSVLLQRTRALREAQYFACAQWTGYTIVNSTTLGSKSLSAVGAALALMQHLGQEGYQARAVAMADATERLLARIDALPELRVLGRPDMNLFAFTTRSGDVFELADRLTERGWHVQPTYAFGCSPAHIHLTLDPGNAARVDDFARDLAACLDGLPPRAVIPEEVVAMLGQLGSHTGASPMGGAGALMASLGISDGKLPTRSAEIHRLLDAAPPAVREALLTMFVGELFA